MSENDKTEREFRKNLLEGFQLMKTRMALTNEDYFKRLKAYGIELSEERIVGDYEHVQDIKALDESYYEQYGKYIDANQRDKVLNSDAFMLLLDRIIPDHFDIAETGDPYFIEAAIENIINTDLRSADQKEIERILKALTVFSKKRDHHTLEDCLKTFDLNVLLKELVRVCHDRNTEFRKLIREMYECFDDMDPSIFPSVYREVKKNGK
jgi:hypothetical protein